MYTPLRTIEKIWFGLFYLSFSEKWKFLAYVFKGLTQDPRTACTLLAKRLNLALANHRQNLQIYRYNFYVL